MLLEREVETAVIERALEDAEAGAGSLVVISGPLGVGRSALLDWLSDVAIARDCTVLRASGARMEQDFEFGIAFQLLEPVMPRLDGDAYDPLLTGGRAPDAWLNSPAAAAALPELSTVVFELSRERTVLLLVDDLQWGDLSSLRWLGYLGRRVSGWRVLVAATVWDGGNQMDHPYLDQITEAAAHTIRPAALTLDSTRTLLRNRFQQRVDEEFVRMCHEGCDGNPMALSSVLDTVAARGLRPMAEHVETVRAVCESLATDRLMFALDAQPEPVRQAAKAMAVLNGAADPGVTARLAGLDRVELAKATRALARAWLLDGGSWPRFVVEAVREAIASDEKERLHMRAAELLFEADHPAESVATQLLEVTSAIEGWAVEPLRAAAESAYRHGDPGHAARLLRRALLASPPDSPGRGRLLLELAGVQKGCDPPLALRLVGQALPLLPSVLERAAAAVHIPPAAVRWDGSVESMLGKAARDLGKPEDLSGREREVALRLEARLRHGSWDDPAQLAAAADRFDALGTDALLATGGGRELAAVLLPNVVLAGRMTAARAAGIAHRIIEREPASPDHVHTALPLAVRVLLMADSMDGIADWLGEALGQARRQGLVAAQSLIESDLSLALLHTGRLAEAKRTARRAAQAADPGWHDAVVRSSTALALVELEAEELGQADLLLGRKHGAADSFLVAALYMLRGSVAASRGDYTTALEYFLDCGRYVTRAGWVNSVFYPWRVWAAILHQRLGDATTALDLAEKEHSAASAWGAALPLGRALRLLGSLDKGERGIKLLGEAVATLRHSSHQRELARALLVLGRRMAAAGMPAAQRHIHEGNQLIRMAGGALPVDHDPPGNELPSPMTVIGTGQTALSKTEHTVAGFAIDGYPNHEIAARLGITRRAVEKHLTNSYRKLGIHNRGELADALAHQADGSAATAGGSHG
jgi:DNA-binding CsgD family transcriptional regulator/tetratricopeptide (TPR) repeat protein